MNKKVIGAEVTFNGGWILRIDTQDMEMLGKWVLDTTVFIKTHYPNDYPQWVFRVTTVNGGVYYQSGLWRDG